MQVAARLKYARVSPQKCRLFADMIRGKAVGDALQVLKHAPNKSAGLLHKLLESAIANAEHNEGADIDELKISEICVDDGPTHRRWRARARGRVNHILKRTSHIRVTVSDV